MNLNPPSTPTSVSPPTCPSTSNIKDRSLKRKCSLPPIDASHDLFPYCIVWSPLPPITFFLPFIGHIGIADSDGVIHDFAGPYTINRGQMAFGSPTRYLQINPITNCSLIRQHLPFDSDKSETREGLILDIETTLSSTSRAGFTTGTGSVTGNSTGTNLGTIDLHYDNHDDYDYDDKEHTNQIKKLYDNAILKGCRVYSRRMHNLFCDNCHSHVCLCLENMGFEIIPKKKNTWNMVYLCFYMFVWGKYTSVWGIVYQWLPFIGIICIWTLT